MVSQTLNHSHHFNFIRLWPPLCDKSIAFKEKILFVHASSILLSQGQCMQLSQTEGHWITNHMLPMLWWVHGSPYVRRNISHMPNMSCTWTYVQYQKIWNSLVHIHVHLICMHLKYRWVYGCHTMIGTWSLRYANPWWETQWGGRIGSTNLNTKTC